MSSPCPPGSGVQCDTIQIIEPDSSLPVGTAGGSADPTLQERGEVALAIGQSQVSVTFQTVKASEVYRFEYLYVDAFGQINPGGILPTVQSQSRYAFTVDLAGAPPVEGYVLRWRVVVISTGPSSLVVDTPESFRVQLPFAIGTIPIPLPPQLLTLTVPFTNPRSNVNYGFSELRVENLDDDPVDQVVINIQVVAKTLGDFTITFNPVPITDKYFLVGRTP